MKRLAAIVEGHGECEAVPILLRRLAAAEQQAVEVLRPIRIPRGKLVKEGELRRAIQLAATKTQAGDGILVLLDADDDCPARFGPELHRWALAERPDRRIAAVLARREFETWFVAAAASLVAAGKLQADTEIPPDPEQLADAKGWLTKSMGSHYSPTVDQPKLAATFDLDAAAASSPSFAKLRRDFRGLLAETPPRQPN